MLSNDIKKLQENAVKQLLNSAIMNSKKQTPEELTFKAPTGSGKTYMIAMFCDLYLEENPDVVFLISSLSKAGLSEQNFDKFEEYKKLGYFSHLNNYLISSDFSEEEKPNIPTDRNIYFLAHDLFKENSILSKYGTLEGLLKYFQGEIQDFSGTTYRNPKKVILIKDECHIATGNIDSKLINYFSLVVNFSATPNIKKGQIPTVEITDSEAVRVHLIKAIEHQNKDTDAKNDIDNFKTAITKFEEVKKEYQEKLHINPCLIVQISNKKKGDEELTSLKNILAQHDKLLWIAMFDDVKKCETNTTWKKENVPVSKWKNLCKSSTSNVDVIIFKLSITEGWDIPRACMLYQIRDTQSDQLNEQVLGRIRRNPILLDYDDFSEDAQELSMKAWVWGSLPGSHKWESVKLQKGVEKNIRIKTTKIVEPEKIKDFDFANFVKTNNNESIAKTSIFDLYKSVKKTSSETKKYIFSARNYEEWTKFAALAKKIDNYIRSFEEDYEKSMEIADEVSFATSSCFEKSEDYLEISDWVWVKKGKNAENDEEYSFDSFAEKKFAKFLRDIASKSFDSIKKENDQFLPGLEEKSYCYGRNFFVNSPIKFEYYNLGTHFSYPDFVAKGKNGKIHLFEVKSVNTSSTQNLDKQEYEEKIKKLKEAYKFASKITGQNFYIPLLVNDTWQISFFADGNDEQTISSDVLEKMLQE